MDQYQGQNFEFKISLPDQAQFIEEEVGAVCNPHINALSDILNNFAGLFQSLSYFQDKLFPLDEKLVFKKIGVNTDEKLTEYFLKKCADILEMVKCLASKGRIHKFPCYLESISEFSESAKNYLDIAKTYSIQVQHKILNSNAPDGDLIDPLFSPVLSDRTAHDHLRRASRLFLQATDLKEGLVQVSTELKAIKALLSNLKISNED